MSPEARFQSATLKLVPKQWGGILDCVDSLGTGQSVCYQSPGEGERLGTVIRVAVEQVLDKGMGFPAKDLQEFQCEAGRTVHQDNWQLSLWSYVLAHGHPEA